MSVRKMLIIKLVNPPPAPLSWPSIGLTQLASVLRQSCPKEQVFVSIEYLNYHFANLFGFSNYEVLRDIKYYQGYNYFEWYFRNSAFPGLNDNQESYFKEDGLAIQNLYDAQISPKVRKKILIAHNLLEQRNVLNASIDQIIMRTGLDKADVVGFSSMFNQNVPVLAIARRIKLINPETTVVIGGSNCESPMGEEIVRNFECVDFVFSGPALKSFREFVESIVNSDTQALHNIDGVFSRENLARVNTGNLSEKRTSEFIAPIGKEIGLDVSLDLDYSEFFKTRNLFASENLPEPKLFFETSKGCWWGEKAHCTFCGLNLKEMPYKASSIEKARDIITSITRRYYPEVKYFASVDNIMPPEYPEEVFEKISIDAGANLFYEVKSNLTFAQLLKIKNAGVKFIQPGIEALDSTVLKLMKKGVTSTQNIRFLKDATSLGMSILWNLLIGFPGESEDYYINYKNQIPHLFHIHPPDVVGGVNFSRYSPYHTFAKQYKLELEPHPTYQYLYPDLPQETLNKMVYFFRDANPDAEYLQFRNHWTIPLNEMVNVWQKRWFGEDNGPVPQLLLDLEKHKIFDTRDGSEKYYSLTEEQVQLIEFLQEPRSSGKLQSASVGNLKEDLRKLLNLGLVFHDQFKTYISLVMNQGHETLQGRKRISFY